MHRKNYPNRAGNAASGRNAIRIQRAARKGKHTAFAALKPRKIRKGKQESASDTAAVAARNQRL
jgi:hypothetical protein